MGAQLESCCPCEASPALVGERCQRLAERDSRAAVGNEATVDAADAAAALIRRVAQLGPHAPLSEIADKWRHLQGVLLEVSATSASSVAVRSPRRHECQLGTNHRKVRFDTTKTDVFEITPYSEIYGLHPREFVFGKHYQLWPSGGTYGFVDVPAAERGNTLPSAAEDESASDEASESSSDSDADWCEFEWEPPTSESEPITQHALAEQAMPLINDSVS